jgi:hypothetical protein
MTITINGPLWGALILALYLIVKYLILPIISSAIKKKTENKVSTNYDNIKIKNTQSLKTRNEVYLEYLDRLDKSLLKSSEPSKIIMEYTNQFLLEIAQISFSALDKLGENIQTEEITQDLIYQKLKAYLDFIRNNLREWIDKSFDFKASYKIRAVASQEIINIIEKLEVLYDEIIDSKYFDVIEKNWMDTKFMTDYTESLTNKGKEFNQLLTDLRNQIKIELNKI